MKWVKFEDQKPPKSGWYFYKGKDFGGWEYYSEEDEWFLFSDYIPRNKVAFDYLEWLDETTTNDENIQNAKD